MTSKPPAETNPSAPDANAVSMSDFIFGTLATDELRVTALKTARYGLAHNYEVSPRDPRPGQPTRIEISAGPGAAVTDVFVHYTVDGSIPVLGDPGTRIAPATRGNTRWDTLLWGYVRQFTGELPAQPEGTVVRYRISGLLQDGGRLWARDERGHDTFSFAVDRYQVPTWVQDAVFYHIFVDRFAPSPGRQFATPARLDGFFGGTLRGVLSKLDYLSELGINALWLSPIYPSPSHHGYDPTNLRHIEPRLGTRSDFKALVEEVHGRGMRIILDFVPNHTSNRHPFFESASSNPESPYRNYYTFVRWPDDYECFFGVKSLPRINNNYLPARRHVIDSALYWMNEFRVDGFRLDHAQGPSHDFWTDYYTAVKAANPQSFHFGEIVESPEFLSTYEGILDGALDFNWLQSARKLFAFGSETVGQFEQFQSAHESYWAGRNFARLSFLDNHDMNRFLWVARGDVQRLMLAAACQFTLSAIPVIYYGTEVGLSQLRDVRQGEWGIMEEARLPMLWGQAQNRDLLAFYRLLIALRRSSPALRTGTRGVWLSDPAHGRYGYLRRAPSETMAVALNVAGESQAFDLPNGVVWRDAFSGDAVPGRLTIETGGFRIVRQA